MTDNLCTYFFNVSNFQKNLLTLRVDVDCIKTPFPNFS